jgi:hypothetical protein
MSTTKPDCNISFNGSQYYQQYTQVGAVAQNAVNAVQNASYYAGAVSFVILFIIFLSITFSVAASSGISNAGSILLIVLTLCSLVTSIVYFVDYNTGKNKPPIVETEKITNCNIQTDPKKLTTITMTPSTPTPTSA